MTELRGNSVKRADTLNLPVANTSKHQFNVQSRRNLLRGMEFDSALYHYNGIPGYEFGGTTVQDVPTYNRVDLGRAYRRFHGFTFSVWAHDVGGTPHLENRHLRLSHGTRRCIPRDLGIEREVIPARRPRGSGCELGSNRSFQLRQVGNVRRELLAVG